jgi:hypothetical protein
MRVSRHLAYLIGYWTGDGTLENPGSWIPDMVLKGNPSDLPEVIYACSRLGYRTQPTICKPGVWVLRPGPEFKLAAEALDLDVRGMTAYTRRLPKSWPEWNISAHWALLTGLIDSDGHIFNPDVPSYHSPGGSYSTVCKELAEDVQALCETLNLGTKLNTFSMANKKFAKAPYEYKVQLRKASIIILHRYVVLQARKQLYVEGWMKRTGQTQTPALKRTPLSVTLPIED